jgi:hypothetical protein
MSVLKREYINGVEIEKNSFIDNATYWSANVTFSRLYASGEDGGPHGHCNFLRQLGLKMNEAKKFIRYGKIPLRIDDSVDPEDLERKYVLIEYRKCLNNDISIRKKGKSIKSTVTSR